MEVTEGQLHSILTVIYLLAEKINLRREIEDIFNNVGLSQLEISAIKTFSKIKKLEINLDKIQDEDEEKIKITLFLISLYPKNTKYIINKLSFNLQEHYCPPWEWTFCVYHMNDIVKALTTVFTEKEIEDSNFFLR